MADHVRMKAPAHYLRVDLADAGEAEYWQVVLDATRAQVEAAVAAVGGDALDVRAWLEARRAPGARGPDPRRHDPGRGADTPGRPRP
jgi:hypothetical protein